MKKISKNKKYFFLVAIRLPQRKIEWQVQRMKGGIDSAEYEKVTVTLKVYRHFILDTASRAMEAFATLK